MKRRTIICAVTTLCIVMGLGAMAALASSGGKRHHHRFSVIGPPPPALTHATMRRAGRPHKPPKPGPPAPNGGNSSASASTQTTTTGASTATTATASASVTATSTSSTQSTDSPSAATPNTAPSGPGKPGKAPKGEKPPKPAKPDKPAKPGDGAGPCQDHCDTSTDNSPCHDHCYGSGDSSCHDHCYGSGDTSCHDHCYGSGDTSCHDHCYGGSASQCNDSCESSDSGAGTPNPSSPSPTPTTPSPPPSSAGTSTPPPTPAQPTTTPVSPTTPSPVPVASTGPAIHISRPAVGPLIPQVVGLVPPGASAFAAGTQGQASARGNHTLASSLAHGTTAVGAGGRTRQAVLGAHVTRPGSRSGSQPANAANTSSSAPATVIERFITSIPASIWIVLGALLLLAASAAAAAWRSSVHARRQTAVAAAVSAAALTDSLTGILNRRGFVEAFERELDRARRYDRPLALAFVDVRGLKAVNDSHGHLAGDRLLQDVAAMLGESARAHDIVGRIGGDELGVLLPEQSSAGVARVVQRVRAQVDNRRYALGFDTPWDLTVGVALFPEDGEDVEELLEVADRRLYQQRGIELR